MHHLKIITLFPFSMMYGLVLLIRNMLYDCGVFKTYRPKVPTVVVGNLSLGGTGKSPHIEFLIRNLKNEYRLAVVSRGYGRKTKGFIEVTLNSKAQEVGDEPLQMKLKFPEISFVVCENRVEAIQKLSIQKPDLELVLLDDAMQHRRISGAFVILLSLFDKPFFKDWVVPSGSLREFAFLGKNRAQTCVYTKCPESVSEKIKTKYAQFFSNNKSTYFSRILYDAWMPMSRKKIEQTPQQLILVTGIAHPQSLLDHLKKSYQVEHVSFGDHHNYTPTDIAEVHRKFTNFDRQNTCIVCTEKDAIKLREFSLVSENGDVPWYSIPMRVFLEEEEQFLKQIHQYVKTYPRSS